MAVTGYLAEISLPEILQFLEQRKKKGLLTIRTLPAAKNLKSQVHYIWLLQGRIVAAANRLDDKGLVSKIVQQGWLSDRVAFRLAQVYPSNRPMGLWLKSQGMLQTEQLKLLFHTQVVGQVSALFELRDGQFEINLKTNIPLVEMTGLSLSGTEATLMALRALRDWTALAEKLPDPTSGLSSAITGQPQLHLDYLEWQVWEFADGTVSLWEIAIQLGLPIEKVQQIAFRLIVVNLAQEVFMIAATPTSAMAASTRVADNLPEPIMQPRRKTNVTQSLLHNLVYFLRSKV